MTDDEEQRLLKERDRGHRAERLYEDELFQDAVQAVRDDIMARFLHSDPDDDVGRRLARLEVDALDGVVQRLRTHMQTGRLAETQLAKAWAAAKQAFGR